MSFSIYFYSLLFNTANSVLKKNVLFFQGSIRRQDKKNIYADWALPSPYGAGARLLLILLTCQSLNVFITELNIFFFSCIEINFAANFPYSRPKPLHQKVTHQVANKLGGGGIFLQFTQFFNRQFKDIYKGIKIFFFLQFFS